MCSDKLTPDIYRPRDFNLCSNCYHSISHNLLDDSFYTCVLKNSCFQVLLSGLCFDFIDISLIDDNLLF